MDNRPIGVFDSGLGGLTVVRDLMCLMPNESIVYFGDTGRVPYGTRGRDTIISYTKQDVRFLQTFDIKAIVIACGTASAVALQAVQQECDIPVLGVVQPTAQAAALATHNKKIGILGTNGTIQSGAYQTMLRQLDAEIEVVAQSCPLFVPLVENGYAEHEAAYLIAQDYLKPLKQQGVDTIILGCTHYPLLKRVISDRMEAEALLIESGPPVAQALQQLLSQRDARSEQPATYRYFVSDLADGFVQLGSLFLKQELGGQVKQIAIECY